MSYSWLSSAPPREFTATAEGLRDESATEPTGKAESYRDKAIKSQDEAYKMARRTRANRGFDPPGRTGNSAIGESGDLMHRRIRSAYLNNAVFRRVTHVLRDLIVSTGIHAFADPVDSSFGWNLKGRDDSELLASLDYALESDEVFERWANDPKQVDVAGRLSWWGMQRLVISELVLVGDAIVMKSLNHGQEIPLQLQMIEREQVDTTRDRPRRGRQNAIVNGFEINEFGREIGVYLFEDHPHDSGSFSGASYRSKFHSAEKYLHIFNPYRPSQQVGATWLHVLGMIAYDRDNYTDAELRTAVKAARHLLVHKTDSATDHMVGFEDVPEYTGQRDDLALGSDPLAAQIGKDDTLEIIEGARPNDKANNFFDIIDHDIANGADLSYYSTTGRFDKTNYGGFKGAMNLEDAQMKPLQNWLGRQLVLPIRRRVNELAVGLGQLRTLTARQYRRERNRYEMFDVIGPGRQLLDAEAENEGDLSELRGGLSTLKIKCARRGLHWIRVLRQMAMEQRVISLLGVTVDHSKGQGGERGTSPAAEFRKFMHSNEFKSIMQGMAV